MKADLEDHQKRELERRMQAHVDRQPNEETMNSRNDSDITRMRDNQTRQKLRALEIELERRATQHPADRIDESLEQQLEMQAERKALAACIPSSWPIEGGVSEFGYDDVDDVDKPLRFDQLTAQEQSIIIALNQLIEEGTIASSVLPFSFEEYQAAARKTAIYNKDARVLYPALGLTGEVGEVLEKAVNLLMMATCAGKLSNLVKKIIRDDNCECDTPRKHDIGKEIGGVLWYCAAVATDLGLSLADIAQENLDILESRQKRGVIQGDGDTR
jgi:NTP pyrophosphatase (non-canonical NTP hydrolase)